MESTPSTMSHADDIDDDIFAGEVEEIASAPLHNSGVVDTNGFTNANVDARSGIVRTPADRDTLGDAPHSAADSKVSCPTCNEQIVKSLLNAHLQQCLNPDIFVDESQDVCIPDSDDEVDMKDQPTSDPGEDLMNYSMPSISTRSDPYADHAAATRIQRERVLSSERQVHDEFEALKQIIPDTELLMSLSVNPLEANRESLLRAFDCMPAGVCEKAEAESRDVKPICELLDFNESPYQLQQKAREQILCSIGRGKMCSEASIYEAASEYGVDVSKLLSTILSNAERDDDGSYVISKEKLRECLAKPCMSSDSRQARLRDSPRCNAQRSRLTSKRRFQEHPRNVPSSGAAQGERSNAHSQNRVKEDSACDALRSSQLPNRNEKCPVCDASVPRSRLEAHLQLCLSQTDLSGFALAGGDTCANDVSKRDERERVAAAPERNAADGRNISSQPHCPLCNESVGRAELESHVQRCMASEGLMDLF